MSRILAVLGSLRLTLVAAVLLGAGVWRIYPGEGPVDLLALSLAALAVNLICALLVHPRLRRDRGLLVLHLALLVLLGLVAAGWLTRLEGHVELVDGQRFADAPLQIDRRGPLHPDRLGRVDFLQEYYTVDYAPGVQRSETRSHVRLAAGRRIVGDDTPLVVAGYRLYTTHNKGFSLVLDWTPAGGPTRRGSVNLPRYPHFDWMQENRFTPPGGPQIELRLIFVGPARPQVAWQLDSRKAAGDLEVRRGGRRWTLRPGEVLQLPQGSLRYIGVRGWMGYQVYYDPTLPWLFWTAVVMAAGLTWHLLARPLRWGVTHRPAGEGAIGNVA